MNGQVLDVILTIGCVEHLWCIVWILFLRDTHVDTNVCVAKRIILERDIKFLTLYDFLSQSNKVVRVNILVSKSNHSKLEGEPSK